MPRQDVHPRLAPAPHERTPGPPRGRAGELARLALVPFAALGAAIAGLVFLVLLPICGIGSIAGAVAQACWGLLREVLAGAPRRGPSRS